MTPKLYCSNNPRDHWALSNIVHLFDKMNLFSMRLLNWKETYSLKRWSTTYESALFYYLRIMETIFNHFDTSLQPENH